MMRLENIDQLVQRSGRGISSRDMRTIKLLNLLQDQLLMLKISAANAFLQCDSDRDGVIAADDLTRAPCFRGINLKPSEAEQLVLSMGGGGSNGGEVVARDFVATVRSCLPLHLLAPGGDKSNGAARDNGDTHAGDGTSIANGGSSSSSSSRNASKKLGRPVSPFKKSHRAALLKRIDVHVNQRFNSVREAWLTIAKGSKLKAGITKEQFLQALREHLGLAVTTEELDLLMSAMDVEDTGWYVN